MGIISVALLLLLLSYRKSPIQSYEQRLQNCQLLMLNKCLPSWRLDGPSVDTLPAGQ